MTVLEPARSGRRWRLGHLFVVLLAAFALRELWVRFGSDRAPGATGGAGAVAAEALVLVTLDSLRSDRLATFGGAGVATPALDEFARKGFACGDLTTTSTGTNAALATLFTGLDPLAHGVTSLRRLGRQRLRPSATTLAEELADAGWRTAGFAGLVQLGPTISGLEQGFELFVSPTVPGTRLPDEQLLARPELANVLARDERLFLWVHLADTRAGHPPVDGLDPAAVATILSHHMDAIAAEDDDVRAALERAQSEPAAAIGDLEAALGRQRGRPERAALDEALYDLRVRSLDRAFGALVERVRARRPDASIALCATQGRALGNDDPVGVRRVPFVLQAPGLDRSVALHGARAEDVAALLAELAGAASATFGPATLAEVAVRGAAGRRTLFVRNDLEDYALLGPAALDGGGVEGPSRTADGVSFGAGGAGARELACAGVAIELGDDVDAPIEVYARAYRTGWLALRGAEDAAPPGPLELPQERQRLRDVSERLGGSRARGLVIETLAERPALRLSLVGPDELLADLAVDGWGPWALPRVALDARDPWPLDEAGEPLPPTVDVGRLVGRTLGAVVGPEPHSPGGQPAELLIGVWPPDEHARFEVKPGPRVFLQVAPGRPNWVLAKGVTPLMVEIEKPPSAQLAFAARVAERNVGPDEMRYQGERFTKAGRAVVILPAWLPGLTDRTARARPTSAVDAGVRLAVWGPPIPPDAWSLCGDAEQRFLERLEPTQ